MPNDFAELVDVFLGLLSMVIPLIFSVALLVILWKVIDAWILHAGDTAKIEEGKQYAFWGILVLVAMTSIWAIIRIVRTTFLG